MTQEFREAARKYYEQGYVIIPFRYGKNDKGEVTKKPDITEWGIWQSRPQTQEEFDSLRLETADGFGLLCGIANKEGLYLAAVDYDVKGKVTEEAKVEGKKILDDLPVTKTDETQSKGLHKYFLSHEPVTIDKSHKNSTALELLGFGALVYLEPSKGYRRINDNDFTVLNDFQSKFNQVLKEHGLVAEKKSQVKNTKDLDENVPVTVDIEAILDKNPTLKDVYEGHWEKYDFPSRSEAEYQLVLDLMRYGLQPARIRELMKNSKVGKWNDPKEGTASYRDKTITKAARQIKEKALKPYTQPEQPTETAQPKTEEKEKIRFSPEVEAQIEAEVQQICEADSQLTALNPHLDKMIIGEDSTKQAISVLLLSSKVANSEMKQIILIKATEGSGKSRIMRVLTEGFKVKDVGRFSAHALDFSNLENFEVLRLKELGSMDEEKQGVSTIKFLSSDDQGYTVEITAKNEETGRFTTEQYKIPPITTISSTTRLVLDAQFERRAWLFGMDETETQTKQIAAWKAKMEAQTSEKMLGLRTLTDFEFSSQVYRRFMERFQFQNIIIPFPSSLLSLLGYDVLRIRGDMDKLLTFVKLYAQLNLKRLRLIRSGVYALSPEVAVEAVNLILEPLSGMLSRIDKRAKEVFNALKTLVTLKEEETEQTSLQTEVEVRYDGKDALIDKTVREKIAVKLGKSEKTIRAFFSQLENSAYVSSDNKKPKTFTLLYDVSAIERKLSGILAKTQSADLLICEMEKEAQEWFRTVSENFSLRMGENKSFTEEESSREEKVFSPSTDKKISNPSLVSSQTAFAQRGSEYRQIPKLPNCRDREVE